MELTRPISRREGAALGVAVAVPFAVAAWLVFSDVVGLLLALASLAAAPISGATIARRLVTTKGARPVLTAAMQAVAIGFGAVVLALAAISLIANPDGAGPRELLSELGLFVTYGLAVFGLPALVAIAIPALLLWRSLARRMVTAKP